MAWGVLLITILAVSLIVVSTCQFVALGIASGRSAAEGRRRRELDLRGLRQAAEISRLKSELQSSASASAIAWRVMEVAEVVDESADCRSYTLVDVYRQPLPPFRPGQHVLVRPALAGAYQTTRCYSLSSSPDSSYWRITVKRQAFPEETSNASAPRRTNAGWASSEREEGGLSTWLHDNVATGDCLLIGGPSGHFMLSADNPRPVVLLAAGVGITPMASMLLWSQQATPARPVRVFYQAKDLEHWPLGQALHQASATTSAISVTSYFSRATEPQLKSLRQRLPGELRVGKFSVADAMATAQPLDCDYFLCGPNAWMETLRDELLDAGVEGARVHWESFGAAAALPTTSTSLADELQQAVPVRFEHSGVSTTWSDPEQTLWELARQHQVDIPSGCLSGVCGCCRVKLLEGKVVYDRPVAVELADDECLTCVARPKTACRLDA